MCIRTKIYWITVTSFFLSYPACRPFKTSYDIASRLDVIFVFIFSVEITLFFWHNQISSFSIRCAAQVANRRKLLETILSCMERIDVAQHIVTVGTQVNLYIKAPKLTSSTTNVDIDGSTDGARCSGVSNGLMPTSQSAKKRDMLLKYVWSSCICNMCGLIWFLKSTLC